MLALDSANEVKCGDDLQHVRKISSVRTDLQRDFKAIYSSEAMNETMRCDYQSIRNKV